MHKIIARGLSTLIAGFALESSAVADSTSSRASPCWKEGNTLAISECLGASGEQSNADLDRTYGRIISVLDAGDRQGLEQAQRLWLAYRDATCVAERRLWSGGTGGNPAYLACVDDETRHRLDYLHTTYRLRLQRLELAPSAK
jgi:uncharacterized protein YecT (DUF1311 family)